jgi:hypothetical protein
MHPVSTEVNNVRNRGAELREPIDLDAPSIDDAQGRLL